MRPRDTVVSFFPLGANKLFCDLSHISPCQNMVQGCFMVGAAHKSRLMRSRCKNTWPCRCLRNPAINLVLKAGKDLGDAPPSRGQCVIVRKKPPGMNAGGPKSFLLYSEWGSRTHVSFANSLWRKWSNIFSTSDWLKNVDECFKLAFTKFFFFYNTYVDVFLVRNCAKIHPFYFEPSSMRNLHRFLHYSFWILFIHLAFLLRSFLLQNYFVSFVFGCLFDLMHSPMTCY